MSKSPVKFAGVAARAVSGGSGGSSRVLDTMTSMPAFERILGLRKNRRLERAKRAQARADYRKNAAMGYRDRMRAGTARGQYVAAPVDELSSVTPTIEANNSVDNTVAAAQDRSQMRDAGELTGVAGPAGFSTMSSAVLDPISRQPMGGVQSVPNIQEQTTPEDVATYGVAGAAESMFGTPMQRQMSMGSSLMKRACKYKNKK